MSRISGNSISGNLSAFTKAVEDTPAAAMQRLKLTGAAAVAWDDIVRLDSTGTSAVVRGIDAERVSLEKAYTRGTEADQALKSVEETLAEIDELADANARRSTSGRKRRENQEAIDTMMAQIAETLASKGMDGEPLFDGNAELTAAAKSFRPDVLKIEKMDLEILGKVSVNGRALSLADFESRRGLDTASPRRSAAAGARRAIDLAAKTIAEQRERIQSFQQEVLVPRLGDVATALEGLYNSTAGTLASQEETMQMAKDLREMMLASASIAAGVAASGWDRERVLELVQ